MHACTGEVMVCMLQHSQDRLNILERVTRPFGWIHVQIAQHENWRQENIPLNLATELAVLRSDFPVQQWKLMRLTIQPGACLMGVHVEATIDLT